MSLEIESAKRIIEEHSSPEDIRERLNLPTGFVTEMGSSYQYTDVGRIKRHKYDGTNHEQGIAVFLPNTPQGNSMAIRVRHHLEKERTNKLTIKIVERTIDKKTGQPVGIYRTRTEDVEDPFNLGVILIDGDTIVDGVDVSIVPEIGARVLEMDTLANGSINIHPGHKVTDIIK